MKTLFSFNAALCFKSRYVVFHSFCLSSSLNSNSLILKQVFISWICVKLLTYETNAFINSTQNTALEYKQLTASFEVCRFSKTHTNIIVNYSFTVWYATWTKIQTLKTHLLYWITANVQGQSTIILFSEDWTVSRWSTWSNAY